jgi:hypothetical protein
MSRRISANSRRKVGEISKPNSLASESFSPIGQWIDAAMAAGAISILRSGIGEWPIEEQLRHIFLSDKHHHELKRFAYVILLVRVQAPSPVSSRFRKTGPAGGTTVWVARHSRGV